MSRLSSESNPGMQVARSSNNIYTLLLLLAFLTVAAALVYMGSVNTNRFGFSMPVGDEYAKSLKEAEAVKKDTADRAAEMARGLSDARNLSAGSGVVDPAGATTTDGVTTDGTTGSEPTNP